MKWARSLLLWDSKEENTILRLPKSFWGAQVVIVTSSTEMFLSLSLPEKKALRHDVPIQSWLKVIALSVTSPHTLYRNMLRWDFDVERVDVILGHNVGYTGSMSRLPILVLECSKGVSKGGHQERGGMPGGLDI